LSPWSPSRRCARAQAGPCKRLTGPRRAAPRTQVDLFGAVKLRAIRQVMQRPPAGAGAGPRCAGGHGRAALGTPLTVAVRARAGGARLSLLTHPRFAIGCPSSPPLVLSGHAAFLHPVLIGHAASLSQVAGGRGAPPHPSARRRGRVGRARAQGRACRAGLGK